MMLLIGADPLTRFLNAAAERPFVWGEFDCLLWLADWIETRRGIDLGVNFRGCYSTMLQAARIVRDADGMVSLVDMLTRGSGVRRASVGARGDIAIVSVAGDGGAHFGNEAGAILLGGSAALISQQGLVVPRMDYAPVVAAWKV